MTTGLARKLVHWQPGDAHVVALRRPKFELVGLRGADLGLLLSGHPSFPYATVESFKVSLERSGRLLMHLTQWHWDAQALPPSCND